MTAWMNTMAQVISNTWETQAHNQVTLLGGANMEIEGGGDKPTSTCNLMLITFFHPRSDAKQNLEGFTLALPFPLPCI